MFGSVRESEGRGIVPFTWTMQGAMSFQPPTVQQKALRSVLPPGQRGGFPADHGRQWREVRRLYAASYSISFGKGQLQDFYGLQLKESCRRP